jgi:RHS repeat-associated protein
MKSEAHVAAGQVSCMILNGVQYYYLKNAQGDVVGIYDSYFNIIVMYSYDTWGKLLSIKDGNGYDITNDKYSIGYLNPIRYRGYYYDSETGLYYLQSRYYDPELGRFINADDVDYLCADGSPLSYNLFTYCLNNRVSKQWTEIQPGKDW